MTTTPTPTASLIGHSVVPIWEIDWSQFVPDAILTLVTGALIGLWLWRVQRGAESRAERRHAESLWRLARTEFIGMVGVRLEGLYPDTMRQFERFRATAARFPLIGAWVEAAPKNLELRAVTSILTTLPLVQQTGVELELAVKRIVNSIVSDTQEQKLLDLATMWVATGRAPGAPSEYEYFADKHSGWVAEVLSDAEVTRLRERHLATLSKLASAQSDLRSHLWKREEYE